MILLSELIKKDKRFTQLNNTPMQTQNENGAEASKVNGKPARHLSKAEQRIQDNHRAIAERVQKKLLEFTNRFVDFLINTDELSTAIMEAKVAQLDKQWRMYLYQQGIVSKESAELCAYNCNVVMEKFEARMQDAPEQHHAEGHIPPGAESSAPMEVVKPDIIHEVERRDEANEN